MTMTDLCKTYKPSCPTGGTVSKNASLHRLSVIGPQLGEGHRQGGFFASA